MIQNTLNRWWRAIEGGDAGALRALYRDDEAVEITPGGVVLEDPDAIVDHYRWLLERFDVRIELESARFEVHGPVTCGLVQLVWRYLAKNPRQRPSRALLGAPAARAATPTGAPMLRLHATVLAETRGTDTRIAHAHFSLL